MELADDIVSVLVVRGPGTEMFTPSDNNQIKEILTDSNPLPDLALQVFKGDGSTRNMSTRTENNNTGSVLSCELSVDLSSTILEPKLDNRESDSVLHGGVLPGTEEIEQNVAVLEKNITGVEESEKNESEDNYSYLDSSQCPVYDFTEPYQITGAWKCFKDVSEMNYTRGCKWSPDGSCLLTNSDDNCLRLFNLPDVLYQKHIDWNDVHEMYPALSIQENELIQDYCWYPHMTSLDPASCCLVSSSRNSPVHMWDAFTGELRCTYRPYNHLDEIVSAHSLAFDPSGSFLLTGFNKMIRFFDVTVPGRKFEEISTKVDRQGQHGIVSCIAFNPANTNQFAAGTYSKTIGLYKFTRKKLLSVLEGQSGGVTHLQFSPDGTKLYSGSRMDPEILCWDLRFSKQVLFSMLRMVTTNQRMYFDISSCGRYLVSGNNNGVVTVWDTSQTPKLTPGYVHAVLEPLQYFTAHGDCTNGISLHGTLPVLATTSGQRKFPDVVDDSDDESMFSYSDQMTDNSLRLWWIGSPNIKPEESPVIVLD